MNEAQRDPNQAKREQRETLFFVIAAVLLAIAFLATIFWEKLSAVTQ